jgi:alpha-L-arabinofuranosidase
MVILSSPNPTDENSFEAPQKIAPLSSAIFGLSSPFTRTLAPYSLTILRIPLSASR